MKYNLNYIRLLTDNYQEMWKFYTETMGMKSRFNDPNSKYDEFETHGSILSIFDKNSMQEALGETIPSSQGDSFVIIFAVHDLDELYSHLKDSVVFITKPTDREEWHIRTAHIRDPDGNLIEFNGPLSSVLK